MKSVVSADVLPRCEYYWMWICTFLRTVVINTENRATIIVFTDNVLKNGSPVKVANLWHNPCLPDNGYVVPYLRLFSTWMSERVSRQCLGKKENWLLSN